MMRFARRKSVMVIVDLAKAESCRAGRASLAAGRQRHLDRPAVAALERNGEAERQFAASADARPPQALG
jgi:hypothetical protein